MPYVGSRIKRSEDRRLLRGIARFVGDIHRVGVLHAAVLRSPHAHARIARIETSRARTAPRVAAVFTFEDIVDVKPIPMRSSQLQGLERALQRPLASDRVRYVGEPVALVVAESRYEAEDALELIDVEYEPLEAVTDGRQAVRPGAPIVHESVSDNLAAQFLTEIGDVDRAMAEADEVFEAEFFVQRHAGVPMETRGLVAEYDQGRGVLTMWGPTKIVHSNRQILSNLLGLPESRIHFIEPDVGGGFGIRGEFYPEDFLIPFAVMRLGRPVGWIEDRAEHLKAANQSREQWHRVKVGVKRDGTILGIDDQFINNHGAYIRTHGATAPLATAGILRGPMHVEHFRCHGSCVLTNKTPTGTYRGPGRYEAAFVRERLTDMVAHRLNLDPAEVRRRNLIRSEQMPYPIGVDPLGSNKFYDSGDYPALLEQALERSAYAELRAACTAARGEGRAMGVGIGCYVETSGRGPWEYGRVEVDPSGEVVVYTGGASLGQGIETILAQIVADELGARFEDVRVVHGDTDQVPYGIGSFASRGTVMAGNAAHGAARKVREKLLQLGASALEVDPLDLSLERGRIVVRGAPERSLTFADAARLSLPANALPRGLQPGISATHFFANDSQTFPYGVHVALVEVETETGMVRVHKYLVADDVGRVVNPMLVEGQIDGAFAQGLGGALLEEFAYGPDGQALAASFMDYLLPTAMEVPTVEHLILELSPSPLNPLGVKGAGEGGLIAVGAAIANAVSDALGVEVTTLPLKPEYVRELARQSAARRWG